MKSLKTEHGAIMFDDEDYIRFIELTDYHLSFASGRMVLKFPKTNQTLTSFILGHRRRVTFLDCNVLNVTKGNLALLGGGKGKKSNSKYLGVYKTAQDIYRVTGSNKSGYPFHVGMYENEIVAAIAYNKAMTAIFGVGNFMNNKTDLSDAEYKAIYDATVRQTENKKYSHQGYIRRKTGLSPSVYGAEAMLNKGPELLYPVIVKESIIAKIKAVKTEPMLTKHENVIFGTLREHHDHLEIKAMDRRDNVSHMISDALEEYAKENNITGDYVAPGDGRYYRLKLSPRAKAAYSVLTEKMLSEIGVCHATSIVNTTARVIEEQRLSEMIHKNDIGKMIRAARMMRGSKQLGKPYTQKRLALDINKTTQYVGDLESGRVYPTLLVLNAIAVACEVRDSFFYASDKETDSTINKEVNISNINPIKTNEMGNSIRKARRFKSEQTGTQYTQKKFAKDLGVSLDKIASIEMGSSYPDEDILNRIALLCGVSLEFFSGWDRESSDCPSTFGAKLRGLRIEAGISQVGLTELLRVKNPKTTVNTSAISKWENGKNEYAKINDLVDIADTLGVTTDYLLRSV